MQLQLEVTTPSYLTSPQMHPPPLPSTQQQQASGQESSSSSSGSLVEGAGKCGLNQGSSLFLGYRHNSSVVLLQIVTAQALNCARMNPSNCWGQGAGCRTHPTLPTYPCWCCVGVWLLTLIAEPCLHTLLRIQHCAWPTLA